MSIYRQALWFTLIGLMIANGHAAWIIVQTWRGLL